MPYFYVGQFTIQNRSSKSSAPVLLNQHRNIQIKSLAFLWSCPVAMKLSGTLVYSHACKIPCRYSSMAIEFRDNMISFEKHFMLLHQVKCISRENT